MGHHTTRRHSISMKKILFSALFLLFSATGVLAQQQDMYKYWVALHDKAGSPYSIDAPADYLSQRALERRRRQQIAIDSLDLPVSPAYLQILRQAGFTVRHCSKWFNGVILFAADSAMVSTLYSMDFVDTVILCDKSPAEAPATLPSIPTEQLIPSLYGTRYDSSYYNLGYPQIAQINGTALHRRGYEGQGIVIGVCDGGFPGVDNTVYFDSMRHDGRLLGTRDFVWSNNNVFSVHDHGTKVLSLMAANLPGHFVGTAPKASYVLCRTENTESETILEEYNWIAAAEYLDSLGADIITSSLGYFRFDDSTQNHSPADLDGRTTPMTIAGNIAVSRGMLVINAAGNDGDREPGRLNSPADAVDVLTIGAATIDNSRASFSSFGPTADGRIKPDVMALGHHVTCAAANGSISTTSGTSLATPIMAGMMACLWQRHPELTPYQLCDSVRAWGSHANCPDTSIGYGIPDFARAFPQDTTNFNNTNHPHPAVPTFALYPNPCHNYVDIQLPPHAAALPHTATLVFRNMLGREVRRQPVHTHTLHISLNDLPPGVYYATLVTPTSHTSRKFLLQ